MKNKILNFYTSEPLYKSYLWYVYFYSAVYYLYFLYVCVSTMQNIFDFKCKQWNKTIKIFFVVYNMFQLLFRLILKIYYVDIIFVLIILFNMQLLIFVCPVSKIHLSSPFIRSRKHNQLVWRYHLIGNINTVTNSKLWNIICLAIKMPENGSGTVTIFVVINYDMGSVFYWQNFC